MAKRQDPTRAGARDLPLQHHRGQPRRDVWHLGLAAIALAGCTSTVDAPPSSCPDISGNYAASFTRLSGTCDPKIDGDGKGTISFTKAADGSTSMVYPGIDGACPGTLDANCRFVSTCKLLSKDGNLVATASVDYKFTATGFSGSASAGYQPPAVTAACTATYQEQGNKL